MLYSLIFTLALPSAILMKTSGEDMLGPAYALCLALSFPIVYTLWDFLRRREVSWISCLGFVNVILTGGLGLMEVEGIWFAFKEASIPLVIATMTLLSLLWKEPLICKFFFHDALMNVNKVRDALQAHNQEKAFHRLIQKTTIFIAMSFLLSSVLNFMLAMYLLKSEAGTPAFNEELAHMQLLSYPVIVLPSMLITGLSLYFFFQTILKLTGLKLEDMVVVQGKKAPPSSSAPPNQVNNQPKEP